MRVLMATGIYDLAGSSIVVENLAKQLSKKGVDVTIGASMFKRIPPAGPYSVCKIPLGNLLKLPKFLNSFDVIHCHHPILNYIDLLTNVPFIYHCHGAPSSGKVTFYKFSMFSSIKVTHRRFACAVALSETGYTDISRYVDPKKVYIIHNGVDTNNFNPDILGPYREGVPQLLFVGNLFDYKKVDELILALKKLVSIYPKAHLQIIGEGESSGKLRNMVQQLSLQDNISFKGIVPNNLLAPYYASCDVYLTASRCEQMPLPLLEAWACGKPVVASSIPAHNELIGDSKAGKTYQPGKISDLTEKISSVYAEKESFSQAAIRYAKDHDWSNVADQVLALYNQVA
jgi:glycosyltransferase involved in cell wall biosynthesis